MDQSAEIAITLVFYGLLAAFFLGIQLIICFTLYKGVQGLPPSFHGVASPGQAFFLMIPFFNLVWLFIYPKKVSLAYQDLLGQYGQLVDDCGEQMGRLWAVFSLCSIIPCIGGLFGIAGLVCCILFIVKVHECKNRAQVCLANGMPVTQVAQGGSPLGPGPDQSNPFNPPGTYDG